VLEVRTKHLPIVRMAGRELQPHQLVQTGEGFKARYELFIDTWAGRTTLGLQDGEERRAATLEIGPHEGKLSADEFDAMLAELSERLSRLIWGLSPGTGSGVPVFTAPAVVHPVVIASQLPVFERLVVLFMADPPPIARRAREACPLNLTRRADLMTLRWLGRRPAVLQAVRGDAGVGTFTDPRTRVDQPKAVLSLNHPMTRFVAYLLRRLVARFQDSARTLRTVHGRPFRVASDSEAARGRLHFRHTERHS
jgi:Domain of unknown function (DUF2357)